MSPADVVARQRALEIIHEEALDALHNAGFAVIQRADLDKYHAKFTAEARRLKDLAVAACKANGHTVRVELNHDESIGGYIIITDPSGSEADMCKRMSDLIASVVDASKLTVGRGVVKPIVYRIADVADPDSGWANSRTGTGDPLATDAPLELRAYYTSSGDPAVEIVGAMEQLLDIDECGTRKALAVQVGDQDGAVLVEIVQLQHGWDVRTSHVEDGDAVLPRAFSVMTEPYGPPGPNGERGVQVRVECPTATPFCWVVL
jgi:hypothetical protein